MFEQSKSFNKLVGFSALSIAGSAAFFSVYGLSKLFAGAQLAVIIMAGSLEFGKLVAASFLYRYWDKINLAHKIYMTIATVVLVLITSAGIFGFPLRSPYAASKWAIIGFTQTAAMELGKFKIRVNAVLPGYIDTKLTQQARVDIPKLQKRVEERTPVGRWGNPDDLEGIAVFLSSEGSNFVSGTAIPVDGGYSING